MTVVGADHGRRNRRGHPRHQLRRTRGQRHARPLGRTQPRGLESIAVEGTTPTEHTPEWLGTTLEFDIVPAGTGTELGFRHAGLTSQLECWDACFAGWTYFMASIEAVAETGTGTPFVS
jgi:hypothetical protein